MKLVTSGTTAAVREKLIRSPAIKALAADNPGQTVHVTYGQAVKTVPAGAKISANRKLPGKRR